jgi:predicted flavoprotein YhiN
LCELVPPAFVSTILDLSKVDPEKETHSLSREERIAIGKTIKDMRMTPIGFLNPEHAIVAGGGVDLTQVDFKTMQSKLFSNLYFIGDVLDIERPSGGYSLQICWSTGFVAGTHSAKGK